MTTPQATFRPATPADLETCADHGDQALVFLVGGLAEHEDVGTELGEGVGDREPGHRESEDRDPQTLPVGVPTGEGAQALVNRHG